LNREGSAEILVEIRNTNHNCVISIMYMNALNNNSNLTMRLKCQHGSLTLSVEKKKHDPVFLTSRLNLAFNVVRFSICIL
jgi:hypothetical protein